MNRASMIASTLTCALLGWLIYQVAYAVDSERDAIDKLRGQIAADRSEIHEADTALDALKAQTALRDLNRRHLQLQEIQPEQYLTLAALPRRGETPTAAAPEAKPDSKAMARLGSGVQVAARPTGLARTVANAKPEAGR